jgi:excinuclease ABC subunit C
MSNVVDIEYQLCPTESLALFLEASLICKYKPKYNVSLRDDKSFPLVKITNEDFPAIFITRKRENDGSRYSGPYTSAGLLKDALRIIRRTFPYRSCRQLPKRACMYYRIGLSPAPCIGKITKQEYSHTIENISLILQGGTEELIKKLSLEMEAKAKELKYEEAANIRDQINTLSAIGPDNVNAGSHFEAQELQNLLKLGAPPKRIEAFDISNIFGKESTGSMVSFYKGIPDKDNYRRFRIKTVEAIDDYGMIREVIHRRYLRLIEEKLPFPDLIIVDGGRAHLLTAKKEIESLGINIPLISIAKERENIYVPDRINPIRLKEGSPALNLIRRLRDEAHRFAISYHHVLRRKKVIGE